MSENKKHNFTEKLTFFAGLLVVLAVVGFLIYQIYQKKNTPPQLQITTSHQPFMENYSFKVEIENTGEETAENTSIKLRLYQDGKATEEGTIDIDYVPMKSKETAWIVFHSERKAGDSLVVSSVTYVKP